MARILDEAAVRVSAESRAGERDAGRAGERFGRAFTRSADRRMRDTKTYTRAGQAGGESFGDGFTRGADGKLRDARGRFVKEGEATGREFGEGFGRGFDRESRKIKPPDVPAAKVKLEPLDAEFTRDLRATITRIARTVQAEIPMNARGERFRSQVAAQIREVEATLRAQIQADPRLSAGFRRDLKTRVDAVARTVQAEIRVDVDRRGNAFTRLLSGITSMARRTVSAVGSAFGSLGSVASSAGSAITSGLGAGISGIRSLLSAVLSSSLAIAGMAVQAALLSPVLAALAGAATAAFGAISAAAIGLPAVLATLAGPIAAIIVGFDGIRRAAETIRPELDHLKTTVSDTFERVMIPIFERIRPLMAPLEEGLTRMAELVGWFADQMLYVVEQFNDFGLIENIFDNITSAIYLATPGLQVFLATILDLLNTGQLFTVLGQTIGGVAERLGDVFNEAAYSGALYGALVQLKDVLFEVTDLIGVLTQGALEFFEGAGPGISGFLHELGESLRIVDWASLGEIFGGLLERVGAAINAIPSETWERLIAAITSMGEELVTFIESGALQTFIEGMTRLIENLGPALPLLIDFANNVISTAAAIAGWIVPILQIIEPLTDLGDTFSWVSTKLGELMGGIGDSGIAEILGTIGDAFWALGRSIKDAVRDFMDWLGISSPSRLFASIGADMLAGLLQGLTGKLQEVLDWFAGLPGKIQEKFRNAKEWLKQAGRDLVQGFVDGITSKIEDAASKAGEMARRAYERAKAVLWEHSPSRRFAELGRNTVEGYIVGLRERAAPMLAAIQALFLEAAARAEAVVPGRDGAVFGSARAATARAVGSGLAPGVDLPTLMAGLAQVLNAAELRADRDGITLMVNDGNRVLARR